MVTLLLLSIWVILKTMAITNSTKQNNTSIDAIPLFIDANRTPLESCLQFSNDCEEEKPPFSLKYAGYLKISHLTKREKRVWFAKAQYFLFPELILPRRKSLIRKVEDLYGHSGKSPLASTAMFKKSKNLSEHWNA